MTAVTHRFIKNASQASPLLWRNALLMLALFAIGMILPYFDAREFHGVSVWHKPAKFFLSIAVQLSTVAWALSLLQPEERNTRGINFALLAMLAAGWLELVIITYRAALGEASHFNTTTAIDGALYSIMGVGALVLTSTAFYVGWKVFRSRDLASDIWREATGMGLMLGAVLGTLTAGYMSAQAGHHVGGELTDATGIPFFHWSTTGGDLRVAHFVGLHAMQLVPLAAIFTKRAAIYAAALAITVITALTFLQAVMGVSLFRA